MVRLFRVILPVTDIEAAARFYGTLFKQLGERVSPGRHYFDCGGIVLACFDPQTDGDGFHTRPNPDHVYFAVANLEAVFETIQTLGCRQRDPAIRQQPWGERSFYAKDPFGNPICFVDERTAFVGQTLST